MKRLLIVCLLALTVGCPSADNSADAVQARRQETLSAEAAAQVGVPSIKNFREMKILKDIFELRDQDGLVTYTYLYCNMTGELIYFGQTIGYGIPAATQFTNPKKPISYQVRRVGGAYLETVGLVIPQSDPNGLFSPTSTTATWVLMKDPNSDEVKPVYVEPLIVVLPFKI